MKLSQNDRILERKLYIALAAVGAVLYSLYCFAVMPAYITTLNDVAYPDAVPIFIEYFGKILEVFAISLFCAITLYGIYRLGAGRFIWGYVIFCGLSFYKYFGNLVATWILDGSVSLTTLPDDLINVCILAVIEILPFAVLLFIVKYIIKLYRDKEAILLKAGKNVKPLPFTSIFNLSNCFMSSAFACAVLVLVAKLGGMLISDMSYIISSGLPTEPVTVVWMLVSYSTSVVFAVLCYFVVILGIDFADRLFERSAIAEK